MSIQACPITWPEGWKRTPNHQRSHAQFGKVSTDTEGRYAGKSRLSVEDGVRRIREELRHFGVDREDMVVSTNLKLRLDGLPYGNLPEPHDTAVAVYWRTPKDRQAKCMAVDRYTRVADNLAAIAATLSAMRAIERHGGAEILNRIFLGFQALPAPEDWWQALGFDLKPKTRDEAEAAYRSLAKVHHPDVGGNAVKFAAISAAIQRAREELR